MDGDAAFWTALFAFATSAVTAAAGYLNNLLVVKKQHAELKARIGTLETEHKECQDNMLTAWPSDHEPLVIAMAWAKER